VLQQLGIPLLAILFTALFMYQNNGKEKDRKEKN